MAILKPLCYCSGSTSVSASSSKTVTWRNDTGVAVELRSVEYAFDAVLQVSGIFTLLIATNVVENAVAQLSVVYGKSFDRLDGSFIEPNEEITLTVSNSSATTAGTFELKVTGVRMGA